MRTRSPRLRLEPATSTHRNMSDITVKNFEHTDSAHFHAKKVRVAIIGVGNCASSLVQGIHFYRNAPTDEAVPGLMHVDLGGYHVGDIEISAAFDINETKVGRDVSQAIFAEPNNTFKFTDVPPLNVTVHRGMTHDGLGKYLSQSIKKADCPTDDIEGILRDTRTDVVV